MLIMGAPTERAFVVASAVARSFVGALPQGALLDDLISLTSFHGVVVKLAVVRLPSGNLEHTKSRVAAQRRTRHRGDLQAFRPAA